MNSNTILTNATGYDVTRMVFSKAEVNTVPGDGPKLTYRRINVGTVNPDGTTGELILSLGRRFSFGVSENVNAETGKVNGYTMPLCLWTKDGATKEEKEWTETFNRIVEKCKEHLLRESTKEEIENYELEANDLKKFNPLYWKREKGKIVEGQGPVLYAKIIESKKTNKILSRFYDNKTDEELDPLSLKGKYCYVDAAVKVESIFIGAKIVLQVKLSEANVEVAQSGPKRLLSRPVYVSQVGSSSSNPMLQDDAPSPMAPPPSRPVPTRQADEEDIQDDDDDDTPSPPKQVSSTPAKKVVPARKK